MSHTRAILGAMKISEYDVVRNLEDLGQGLQGSFCLRSVLDRFPGADLPLLIAGIASDRQHKER